MDGNGRWAQQRRLPVAAGHRAGAKTLRRVLEHALDLGIKEVTVYSFSTENWNRPPEEVEALMQLFVEMIDSQVPDMHERGARVRFVGSRRGVPAKLARRIDDAEALTAGNTRMTLYIAFNYGGRQEILDAAAGLAREAMLEALGRAKRRRRSVCRLTPHSSSPPTICGATSTRPRCTIPSSSSAPRASMRVSNFLLWQCAYSELVFSDKLWPDFDEAALDEALAEYARRQRRFGGRAGGGAGPDVSANDAAGADAPQSGASAGGGTSAGGAA